MTINWQFLYLILGRVLPAPKLVYGQGEVSTMVPRDGTWNMRNLKFIDAKKMLHFGVINLTNQLNDQGINTFISALTRAGQEMGNSFSFPSSFSHVGPFPMALFEFFYL